MQAATAGALLPCQASCPRAAQHSLPEMARLGVRTRLPLHWPLAVGTAPCALGGTADCILGNEDAFLKASQLVFLKHRGGVQEGVCVPLQSRRLYTSLFLQEWR